jgi:hypothetical protein
MSSPIFDIQEASQLLQAIAHHEQMSSYFSQLDSDPVMSDRRRVLWKTKFPKDHMDHYQLIEWRSPDIHICKQTWGSTSCGWGGMGGAAITTNYNVVLVNRILGIMCVYWGGKIAYIAEIDSKYEDFMNKGNNSYGHLPSLRVCDSVFSILHKSR